MDRVVQNYFRVQGRPRKPQHAAEYVPAQIELVRATCLYVATRLGDLMDELVVIGGLVPSLLIRPEALPAGTPGHVGTLDLDVGPTLTTAGAWMISSLASARCWPTSRPNGHCSFFAVILRTSTPSGHGASRRS